MGIFDLSVIWVYIYSRIGKIFYLRKGILHMNKRKIVCTCIISLIIGGTATIGINKKIENKILYSQHNKKNLEACVVNNTSEDLALYNGSGKVTSYVSVGEMLSISKGNNKTFVKVEETGAKGYLNNQNIQIIKSGVNDDFESLNQNGQVINVSSIVNLRKEATMNSKVLEKISNNTKIEIIGIEGDWYKVKSKEQTGFIYREYIGVNNNKVNDGIKNIERTKIKTIDEKNRICSKISDVNASEVASTNHNSNIVKKNDDIVKQVHNNNNKEANKSNVSNVNKKEDNTNIVKKGSVNINKITKQTNNSNVENNEKNSSTTKKENENKVVNIIKKDKKNITSPKVNFNVNQTEFNVSEPFTCSLVPTAGAVQVFKTENPNYKKFSYKQLGGTATLGGKELKISYKGNIDNKVPGIYPVQMSIKLTDGQVYTRKIDVKIKDLPPVIVLKNNMTAEQGSSSPYSNFILGAYSVEGENLSSDIYDYGDPIGELNQASRSFQASGQAKLDLSVKDQYGTIGNNIAIIDILQGDTPVITGKNIVLKTGEKFNISEMDIKVENGGMTRYYITKDSEGENSINSINSNKKGIYYVWVYASNPETWNESVNMFKVTVL